jgi:hypothetical protein
MRGRYRGQSAVDVAVVLDIMLLFLRFVWRWTRRGSWTIVFCRLRGWNIGMARDGLVGVGNMSGMRVNHRDERGQVICE